VSKLLDLSKSVELPGDLKAIADEMFARADVVLKYAPNGSAALLIEAEVIPGRGQMVVCGSPQHIAKRLVAAGYEEESERILEYANPCGVVVATIFKNHAIAVTVLMEDQDTQQPS
jgi:hypothetical protein